MRALLVHVSLRFEAMHRKMMLAIGCSMLTSAVINQLFSVQSSSSEMIGVLSFRYNHGVWCRCENAISMERHVLIAILVSLVQTNLLRIWKDYSVSSLSSMDAMVSVVWSLEWAGLKRI